MTALQLDPTPMTHWQVAKNDSEQTMEILAGLFSTIDLEALAVAGAKAVSQLCRCAVAAVIFPDASRGVMMCGYGFESGEFKRTILSVSHREERGCRLSDSDVNMIIRSIENMGGLSSFVSIRASRGRPGAVRTTQPSGHRPLGLGQVCCVRVRDGARTTALIKAEWRAGFGCEYVNRRKLAHMSTILAPALRKANDSKSSQGGQLGVVPLSPREGEVLELLARGYNTRMIAEMLALRPNTVRSYVQDVLGKLQATNRLMALANARELGLI